MCCGPPGTFTCLQEQWTTEVDIHSSWSGDFYTILNNGEGGTAVSLTFIEMPLDAVDVAGGRCQRPRRRSGTSGRLDAEDALAQTAVGQLTVGHSTLSCSQYVVPPRTSTRLTSRNRLPVADSHDRRHRVRRRGFLARR